MAEAEVAPKDRRRTSTVTRILLAITLLGMVVFVTSIGVAGWLLTRADRGDVQEGSWLFVKLSGPLPEAPQPSSLFEDPEAFPPIASELVAAIRTGAVYVNIHSTPSPGGEIRGQIL